MLHPYLSNMPTFIPFYSQEEELTMAHPPKKVHFSEPPFSTTFNPPPFARAPIPGVASKPKSKPKSKQTKLNGWFLNKPEAKIPAASPKKTKVKRSSFYNDLISERNQAEMEASKAQFKRTK